MSSSPCRLYLGEVHPETDEPGVIIVTPYDESFVEELKQGVGPSSRRFLPHRRAWWIAETSEGYARELVLHHFGALVVVDEDGGEEMWDRRGPVASQGRFL